MRNSYPGVCSDRGGLVETGAGYFQRHKGRWLVRHVLCVAVKKFIADRDLSHCQQESLATFSPAQRAQLEALRDRARGAR
ncbi:hypothetical protein, partial [Klebsiella pneumoniae]|uniref:hypothetical protein n=1 Tax=Klebsiella pneumoniae TaxID=573 RepID=UPI001952C46F